MCTRTTNKQVFIIKTATKIYGKSSAPIKGFGSSRKQDLNVRGLGAEHGLSIDKTPDSNRSTTHSHRRTRDRKMDVASTEKVQMAKADMNVFSLRGKLRSCQSQRPKQVASSPGGEQRRSQPRPVNWNLYT